MFTGIVEELGKVESNHRGTLSVHANLDRIHLGDSVCVNGTCLTVARRHQGLLDFEMSLETLSKTNLGLLVPGDNVNLERSLTLQSYLGGHMVTGHVDGCALILKREPEKSGFMRVRFELPRPLKPFVAFKGSVSVDGVSVTVTKAGAYYFETVLIPHTLKATTLGSKKEKDLVNLEVDIVARYLSNMLELRSR